MTDSSEILRTPLHSAHLAAKAKMGPFAGYDMPLQYEGVIAEHNAVRNRMGIFDVSHMGHCEISSDAVSRVLSRPIGKIPPGKSRYALIMNRTGGIIDDCIAYRYSENRWHIVLNASRKHIDLAILSEAAPGAVTPLPDLAMIAVQGPGVVPLFGEFSGRHAFAANVRALDVDVRLACRTGYTGEDGYEFIVDGTDAPRLWERLLEAGAKPAGLAVRDLLRIEAGLPLYGSDIDETTSPFETGLDFAVDPAHEHVGAEALRANPPRRRRAGLKTPKGSAVPRHGYEVLDAAGGKIGVVTSGTFSPLLEEGIALALVEKNSTPSALLIRNKSCPVSETELPFYRRKR